MFLRDLEVATETIQQGGDFFLLLMDTLDTPKVLLTCNSQSAVPPAPYRSR